MGFPRYIARKKSRSAFPYLIRHGFAIGFVHVRHRNKFRPFFRKPEAERPPDSVCAAGHHHCFSLNLHPKKIAPRLSIFNQRQKLAIAALTD
jgi:hypothetical protein